MTEKCDKSNSSKADGCETIKEDVAEEIFLCV
jgi:hypothetical protein